ncbi:MAG: hypothetical protein WBN90_07250 [Gammaproteobacteria bacterium]
MKRSRIPGAALACIFSLALSTTANAALHSRLGGAAAYDDALNITWLTDAGLSGSNSWANQLAWVAGLNSANHLGFNDWRLASMSVAAGLPTGLAEEVVDCSTIWQPLCRDNELGYMFFHNLGGSTSQDLSGNRTVGDVTLSNIQPRYWSATESGITNAFMYHFDIGFGVWSPKNGNRHAWAVHPGDIGTALAIPDGDIAPLNAPDGVVNAADVLLATRITLGLLTAGPGQLAHGDVYPPGSPDGVINLQDLILITRIALD